MIPFRIIPVPEPVAVHARTRRADEHGNAALEAIIADSHPGYPCRVCLRDAQVGEPMLLFSYSPFERPRPYQSVGPIFVHAEACAPYQHERGVPEALRRRLLSLRAYDGDDRLIGADVTEGEAMEPLIARLFADGHVRYLHAHHARPGCFACRIERA